MREFLSRFRFGDFAAYFLPGLVMLLAVCWSLTLTVFDPYVRNYFRRVSLIDGLFLCCAAYVLGAFLSGSSNKIFPHIYRVSRHAPFVDTRCAIHPSVLADPVRASFRKVFGEIVAADLWSLDHFYLVRSAINERMPHASADAARQNDLMRLRENMMIPLLSLWMVALMFAFVEAFQDLYRGTLLAFIATVVAYLAIGRLAGRAADNRAREVRELCSALVVGTALGMFNQPPPSLGTTKTEALTPGPQDSPLLPIKAPVNIRDPLI